MPYFGKQNSMKLFSISIATMFFLLVLLLPVTEQTELSTNSWRLHVERSVILSVNLSTAMNTSSFVPVDPSLTFTFNGFPNITIDEFSVGKAGEVRVGGIQADDLDYTSYDFGDGTEYITTLKSTEQVAKHTYFTAGFFLLTIGVMKRDADLINKRLVFVKSNFRSYFETSEDGRNHTLVIAGGTDMTLEISVKGENGRLLKAAETVKSDALAFVIGGLIFNDTFSDDVVKGMQLVLISSIVFSEPGFLTAFEFDAINAGILMIGILRPNCDCCIACAEEVSLLGNGSRPSPITIKNSLTFDVVRVIMIQVNVTGFQLHHLQASVRVSKGDIVSFVESSSSNFTKLKYGVSEDNIGFVKTQEMSGSLREGQNTGQFTSEKKKVPYLRTYLSKGYSYVVDDQAMQIRVIEVTDLTTKTVVQYHTTSTVGQGIANMTFTFSPSEYYGYVNLSQYDELQVTINIGSGYFCLIKVMWGDGSIQTLNHTKNPTPEQVFASHTYNTGSGQFAINVSVLTEVETNMNNIVLVNMQQECSKPPRVNFNYGTEKNPIVYTKSTIIEFFADWSFGDSKNRVDCEKKFDSSFAFAKCGFSDKNLTDPDVKIVDNGVVCIVDKNTLEVGKKRMILSMSFKKDDDSKIMFEYTAFIMIIQSNISAVIMNGEYQAIPKLQVLVRGQRPRLYTFELDGSESRDPDWPETTQGLIFEWYCRVKANGKHTGELCNSTASPSTWIKVVKDDYCVVANPNITLKLNTSCLVEGAIYIFRLKVSKNDGYGLRSSKVQQEVKVNNGDPPNVRLRCISNCQQKVNPQERLVMQYKCFGCFGQKLLANWTIDVKNGEAVDLPLSISSLANLVIKGGTFSEGTTYTVSVTLSFPDSWFTSVVQMQKITSTKPHGGYCKVSPKSGEASMTRFKIACYDWTSTDVDDRPEAYEFRYNAGSNADENPLLNPSSRNRNEISNVVLPPGMEKNAYNVTISARIINKYGVYALWQANVIVTPPGDEKQNTSSLLKELEDNKPKVLNDTQAVTAYVSAAGSTVSGLPTPIVPTSEPTVPPNVYGSLVVNQDQLEKEKKEDEKMTQEKKQFNDEMMHLLVDLPMTNVQQIKAASDALGTVTADKNTLSDGSAEGAVDLIGKMSKTLSSLAGKRTVGAGYMEDTVKNVFKSVSNVLSKSYSSSKEEGRNGTDKSKTAEEMRNLLDASTGLMNVLLASKVPGEKRTDIELPTMKLAVKKVELSDMGNMSFTQNDDDDDDSGKPAMGFLLPNLTSHFDSVADGNDDIAMQFVNYKSNVFSWGNDSDKVKSEIFSLAINTGDSSSNISNMPEPITINIKNKPEDLIVRNVSLFLPGDYMFNKTRLNSPLCNMLINFHFINDPDNLTQFIAYVQYGKRPTYDNYDVKLNMSNSYGMIMDVNTEGWEGPANKSSDPNGTMNSCRNLAGNDTKRHVMARKIDNRTILLWDFSNYYWASPNCTDNQTLFFAFFYNGPMPQRIQIDNPYTYDEIEYRGAFNYSVRTFCSKCQYWDDDANDWSSEGCMLDGDASSMSVTSCKCNHLTSFGGAFVAPNALPVLSLDMLKKGYVLLVTVLVILLFYIIGLVFARRADKRDVGKVGTCVLMDNDPRDRYMYEVIVDTGTQRNAGTKSNIFFIASGDFCDSRVHHLSDPDRVVFQTGHSDSFLMTTPGAIGDVNYVRLWHDNSKGGWFLSSVKVIDLQTGKSFDFAAERWLAVDKYDGMIECRLHLTGADKLEDFNYLFTQNSRQALADCHIWLSVFSRPPRSMFTRCQRLSVAISLLFCSMLASCMFYQTEPKKSPLDENRIGNFSFTWYQVVVAIICACIVAPINICLALLFRRIRPVPETDGSAEQPRATSSVDDEESIMETPFNSGADTTSDGNQPLATESKDSNKNSEKGFYLPYWFIYIAWVLCLVIILTCAVVIIFYGMSFGNKTSLEWLSSVTVYILKDLLLVQPFIAFLLALLVTIAMKMHRNVARGSVTSVKTSAEKETWLKKLENQETIFDRVEITAPPDYSELEGMRALRMKELRMSALVREIFFYLLFIIVVTGIGLNLRDEDAYKQTKDVKELLRLSLPDGYEPEDPNKIFENIKSYQTFWDWVDLLLLPNLYPTKWYDLAESYKGTPEYTFPGNIFLNDLSSKIVNGVRLRQMRVSSNSCDISPVMRKTINRECLGPLTSSIEEKRPFNYDWKKPFKEGENIPSISLQNKPWRYQDSSALDTYPVQAQLNTYTGGGYVIEIFPKFDNRAILRYVKENLWVDRQTRVVIIEFATFNGQTNLYDMVMVVFEFPPLGGVIHWYSVQTFKLDMYTPQTMFFVLLSYVLYLLFMIVFCVREGRLIYRIRHRYFFEFWNLIELSLVLLSILGIIFFVYLGQLRKVLMTSVNHKIPNKFINFHFASIWFDLLIHIIALICFFVILKLIKMFRFNNRIYMLSATLKAAWTPLAMFAIMFAVILGSVVFSTTVIFGHLLYGYRDWWATFGSIFGLLLGKFEYANFADTNKLLGPIFFFAFNILINWIVMNVFISILNDTFAEVQAELLAKENEYELVDYMMRTVKNWFGFSAPIDQGKARKLSSEGTENDDDDQSKMTSQDSFSSGRESHVLERFDSFDNELQVIEDDLSAEDVNELAHSFMKSLNVIYFRHAEATRNKRMRDRLKNKEASA